MNYAYNEYNTAIIVNDLTLIPSSYDYIEVEEVPERASDYGNYRVDYDHETLIWVSKDPPEAITEPTDLTEAKIQALTDQQSFLEDCIVEMAEIVYA